MAFEGLSEKLNNVFKKLKSRGKLTEADVKEAMREVRMALLEADVSYKVVKDFVNSVTEGGNADPSGADLRSDILCSNYCWRPMDRGPVDPCSFCSWCGVCLQHPDVYCDGTAGSTGSEKGTAL